MKHGTELNEQEVLAITKVISERYTLLILGTASMLGFCPNCLHRLLTNYLKEVENHMNKEAIH